MNDYEYWSIAGHDLEYTDEDHTYICDGLILPSVTQILKYKFGGKYDGVDRETLNNAAKRGTEVHKAIEDYCKDGTDSDLVELRNFKFLQSKYNFTVEQNEVPVILFKNDEPICAGRLDLILSMVETSDNGNTRREVKGIGDIKRTSALDKDYLAYQLNIYRIALRQSYGINAEFLRGIHLREDVRKFVTIPIDEERTWEFIEEWRNNHE